MVFGSWWQGLLFGLINIAVLSIIGYALTAIWKKYQNN
jgi:hypothetical protein